ncbi:Cationic peroxidase 1 [Acorus calamus]|uniref:peroxidase n=1 Tax=Acorus calamus TaxID=4465 RepID=A0AAV9C675_ACOCL|nr:Cationic peroxidase 1 [Acorus calamus]
MGGPARPKGLNDCEPHRRQHFPPHPFMNLSALISNFKTVGLGVTDLVALSGGHTIGFAHCALFRTHIYNEIDIDPSFAQSVKRICPFKGGDNNLQPLDPTPAKFDDNYFKDLLNKKGLLHSDQELFNGGSTDAIVVKYGSDYGEFAADFVKSMVRMGNLKPLTGKQGEVRKNCRKIN